MAFGGANAMGQAGFLGKPLPGSSFYEPDSPRKGDGKRGIDDEQDPLEYVFEDGTFFLFSSFNH